MTDTAENLSALQTRLLTALLASRTVAGAAEIAGYTERTAYRHLADTSFRQVYRRARREALAHATARLQIACSKAVVTLEAVMDDRTAIASARVAAAKAVLEIAHRLTEQEDVIERLTQLEAKLAEMDETPAYGNGRRAA